MKLGITIRRSGAGWEIDAEAAGKPKITRVIAAAASGFPIPPTSEAAAWAGCPFEYLCSDPAPVKALRQKILTGDTANNVLPILGGYLRTILLGPVWGQAETEIPAGEAIEIEIACDADDGVMNRLPWEMMMSGDQPLGAQKGRVVAVTRLVEGAGPDPSAIAIPLRVLFVIGRQLDPNLRPGAEYLGIIRQVNATLQAGGLRARSVDINLQLLPEATTQELKEAVETFDPSVVHFIAHGRWEGSDSVIVLSKKSALAVEEDPCTAKTLIQNLRKKDGLLPPIVVLNACHTGEANDSYVPFAAALAQGGVAVSLGMAGEVADAACRIFTRALYQALVDGTPIAVAAAFARRAAMLHYGDYLANAEWTRPTLFRNTRANPGVKVNRADRAIAEAAFRFRSVREPAIFCDRIDAMQAYQKFRDQVLAGNVLMPLVLEVSDENIAGMSGASSGLKMQVGKSRALAEIACNAVLQGLAPCVIASERWSEPPPNLLLLAVRIAEVMDDTREFLGLKRRFTSSALTMAFVVADRPYSFDPSQIPMFQFEAQKAKDKAALPGSPPVDRTIVRAVLKDDAKVFLDDLNARFLDGEGKPIFKAALVLIDDLHNYEAVAVEFLGLVNQFGIAPQAALAFTYSTRPKAGPDIVEHIKNNRAGLVYEPLRPFRSPVESRLAYTQMLLSRKAPLAISRRPEKKDNVEFFFNNIHEKVLGVPSFFSLPISEAAIAIFAGLEVLIDADDERILAERSKADG